MTATGEFAAALRQQMEDAQRGIAAAQDAGQSAQMYKHSARLLDLLDRAARSGVDTTGWVSGSAVFIAKSICAENS